MLACNLHKVFADEAYARIYFSMRQDLQNSLDNFRHAPLLKRSQLRGCMSEVINVKQALRTCRVLRGQFNSE